MKKLLSLSFLAFVAVGCQSTAQQTVDTNAAVQKPNNSETVSSHSVSGENLKPPSSAPNNSSGESSPMAKPIDVSEMTAAVEKAEKIYEEKQKDEKAKENLSRAYFVRAFALTEAAQYRAALGDFRKGLKLNPNDREAKNMHDEIIRIFKSINREPPKEGEEPAPMPIKKT
ncbi:MAG: hypothetical protein ACR2MG_03510 [Pyrinomonadaceae bacterium]